MSDTMIAVAVAERPEYISRPLEAVCVLATVATRVDDVEAPWRLILRRGAVTPECP